MDSSHKVSRIDYYTRLFFIGFYIFTSLILFICAIFNIFPLATNLKLILAISFLLGSLINYFDFQKYYGKKQK